MTSTTSRSRTSRPCAAHTLPGEARRDSPTDHRLGGSRHVTVRVRVAAALRNGSAPPLAVRRGGAARDHPGPGSQHPDRHGRRVRRGGSCGVRALPRGVSGLPGPSVEVRDDISELMVSFGRLLIPESAAYPGGPGRAVAAPRGRHPRRHLPERRPATPDAADDRTARLRRDPGGPRRARRVPDRRTGPAASARARGAGGRHRQDARRRRIPGHLRVVADRPPDTGEDRVVHRHPGRRRGRFGQGRDLPAWDHAHPRRPRRGQQPRRPASSASSRWTTSP